MAEEVWPCESYLAGGALVFSLHLAKLRSMAGPQPQLFLPPILPQIMNAQLKGPIQDLLGVGHTFLVEEMVAQSVLIIKSTL